MDGETGTIIHGTVPPHQIDNATVHATVSESWWVLEGHGEIWRDNGLESCVAILVPGTSIDIPVGIAFQRLHEHLGCEGSLMGQLSIETFEEDGKTHEALLYELPTAKDSWAPSSLPTGQKLNKTDPLFKKLDETIVEEELARLG